MKLRSIAPVFVELMPAVLEPGKIYISLEYRVTKHLCASGCGEPVVLPLHPGQWRFTYDGEQVSLAPSVGNVGLSCRAHYWISSGEVVWAKPLGLEEGRKGRARDQAAVERFSVRAAAVDGFTERRSRRPWWRRKKH